MAHIIDVQAITQMVVGQIERELPSRIDRAGEVLLNAKNEILRGQRSGRKYKKHTASAPGEPPAVWTGNLRGSFKKITNDVHNVGIETEVPYAGMLEDGTKRMASRPYKEKIIQKAWPQIEAIFKEPWHSP